MPTQTTLCRSYKFKLRPTREQKRILDDTLALCWRLYNTAIEQRKTAWERAHVSVGYYDQKAELPDLKRAEPDYSAVHWTVLQDVILHVERAFAAFFRRTRAGEKAGYPRFQGEGRYHSFTYAQFGNGARIDGGALVLSKIGRVRVRWSRTLEGTPKTVTLSREPDGWYVCFACADVPSRSLPPSGRETGIDLGLNAFLICADGTAFAHPRAHRKAEKALKKAHRRVSCRKPGSRRRAEAVRRLRKRYQKVARQRRDFHHKTALALVRAYDAIYFEDLRVANLMRGRLAKSIADAGWGRFCGILVCKAAYAGKRALAVSPINTSQLCSGCGQIVPKGLSVRWHRCPHCGVSLDRDHNAALNILRRGREVYGASI